MVEPLTGILGVNRDILGCGVGAKPVANMDVFCFAHESLIQKGVELPSGLKHLKEFLKVFTSELKMAGIKVVFQQ